MCGATNMQSNHRSADIFQRNFRNPFNSIVPSTPAAEKYHFRFSEMCALFRASRLDKRGGSRSSRTRGGVRWT
jgi:hypothetical protein